MYNILDTELKQLAYAGFSKRILASLILAEFKYPKIRLLPGIKK